MKKSGFTGRKNHLVLLICLWGIFVGGGGCFSKREHTDKKQVVFTESDTARNKDDKLEASQRPLDTLISYCYRYSVSQPPEELRKVVRQIQDSVPFASNLYFFAQTYLIQSYYQEGDTKKMEKLLDVTENMPQLKQFPFEQVRLKYARINLYQALGRYDEAMRVSREILEILPVTPEQTEGLKSVFNGALLQIITAYIRAYRQKEGLQFFYSLQQSDNPVLTGPCRRDLAVVTAYMAFKAGEIDTAQVQIEEALKLPFQGDTITNLARDYSYAADIYSHLSGGTEQGIYYWKKALELVREEDYYEIMPWAQASLGELYSKTGHFQKAVQSQYDALKVYESWEDAAGKSYTYSLLADLHTFWGFYEKAGEYVQKSLEQAVVAGDDDSRGKALLARYRLWKAEGKKDSLPRALLQTEEVFRIAGDALGALEAQALRGLELIGTAGKGQEGKDLLAKVMADPAFTDLEQADEVRSVLARELIRSGKTGQGIALLQKSLQGLESEGKNTVLLSCYKFLKDYYARQKQFGAYLETDRKYDAMKDSLFAFQKIQVVAKTRIAYETEKNQQTNRLLKAELELQKRTVRDYVLGGIVLLLLAFCIVVWLGWRHRSLKLEQKLTRSQMEEQEQRLYSLLEIHKQLNLKNEELREEIGKMLEERRESGVASPELETLLRSVAPHLLTEEEEARFRQLYQRLHPDFLIQLRQKCPSVTKNEELLCMLVYLGFSSGDIALALGITHDSVNKSRYRIRRKLNLKKDENLNDWIRKG